MSINRIRLFVNVRDTDRKFYNIEVDQHGMEFSNKIV